MRLFKLKVKKTRRKTPEGEVVAIVREYLSRKGWYLIRNQQGMGSHKGLPDFTAISKDGKVAFIECKAPEHTSKAGHKIKASKLGYYQEQFFSEMQSRKVPCYAVWEIKNLEEAGL